MALNFCPNCGAKLKANAKFCGSCGEKIISTQTENISPMPYENSKPATEIISTQTENISLMPYEVAEIKPQSVQDIFAKAQSSPDTPPPKKISDYDSPIYGNGIVLKSSAPISSKRLTWRREGYLWSIFGGLIVLIIGLAFNSGIIIVTGLLGGVILFWITQEKDSDSIEKHLDELRLMKFKFLNNVDADDIFKKLQPALTAKYGDSVSFDMDHGILSVTYKKIMYDIALNDDATFIVHWHASLTKVFTSGISYDSIREGTAVIAYEIQQQFGIN